MSKELRVEVKKDKYTGRDHVLPDHFNVILNFEAYTPSNSYLFSGAVPEELKEPHKLLSRIKAYKSRILKRKEHLNIDELKRLGKEFLVKKIAPSKSFPSRKGKYFIPGSSIKGAVRSRVEYKFKPFEISGKLYSYSCYSVESLFFDKARAVNHLKFWGEETRYMRSGVCRSPNVCIVCDLFGSPNLASRVYFSDAYMVSGNTEKLIELEGIEAVKPGSKFKLSVNCLNMSLLDLSILFLGFELYSGSPILIGSFKYVYNPKVTTRRFRKKYMFGLLKFTLKNFKGYSFENGEMKEMRGTAELIEKVKGILMKSKYGEHIDFEKGIVEI